MLFWLNPFHTGHKLIPGFAVSPPNLLQTYGGCSIRLVNQMQTCAKHRANLLIPGGQPRQRRLRPAEEAGLSPAAGRGKLGHCGVGPPWRRGLQGPKWARAARSSNSTGLGLRHSHDVVLRLPLAVEQDVPVTDACFFLHAAPYTPGGRGRFTCRCIPANNRFGQGLQTGHNDGLVSLVDTIKVWYVCSRIGKFVQGLVCLFKV